MDDESVNNNDLGIRAFSLIDVLSEDDWLINNSSFGDPQDLHFSENQKEQKKVSFLEPEEANNVDSSLGSFEEIEQIPQPLESSEPERTSKNGKYNLRKSLAWDSAFFTSAGVLDPEELSSMMGSTEKGEKRILLGSTEKGAKHMLPAIQEVVHRSTDSISTLESDTLTLESIEADLFEDVRASIQKSSKASNVANSNGKVGSGLAETQTIRSSKKVDLASQNKLKPKAALKKPSVGMQGSGKMTKQVSVCAQVSQSGSTNGGSTSSVSKPPKVLSRVTPTSTTSTISTKRASLGANRVRMEKDNAGNGTGRAAPLSKVPALRASRNTMPRPTLPSKSSSSSSVAAKRELRTSCSSFDSCDSASSSSISKSSLNSMESKNDTKPGNSPSNSTVKTPSRSASRNKNQSGSPHLSAYLRSVTKLSSSISPASSISEWSSESSSSASTVNLRSNNSKASFDTSSCKGVSVERDTSQGLDSQNHSNEHCLVGNDNQVTGLLGGCVKRASVGTGALLRPASMKPSGLRLPSPKIGFFDGVRSAGRTPNGSMQCHPGVPSASSKIGLGSSSPSGCSNKAKLGKLQPTRTVTATRSAKSDAQQAAMSLKHKSPLALQVPSNAATKVSSALRNVKGCPTISPKVQNRMSPETGGESNLKVEEVISKGRAMAINDPDSGSVENNCNLGVLKDKVSPERKSSAHVKDINGGTHVTGDLSSNSDVENETMSQKVDGDAINGQPHLKNGLHLPYDASEKEKAYLENQVDDLIRQVGAMDINTEIQKELVGDSLAVSSEDNSSGLELLHPCELLVCGKKEELPNGLSKPTALFPTTIEVTANLRMPLAVKDSFCNRDGLLDISTVSTVEESEKTATLPFPESILEENR